MTPVLIACSHGTSSLEGRAAIAGVVTRVRQMLPGVQVEEAFVDVQEPEIDAVVAGVPAGAASVVVPLLLSTGFHTRVDIARAVAAAPGPCVATPALGPHDLLAGLLAERLRAAGLGAADAPPSAEAVVLAAAGSSDPAAEVDVAAMADLLAARLGMPVSVGFAAGAGIRIDAAVAAARSAGATRVFAASYVLAPGHFAGVIAGAGADVVTDPLAPDEAVAAVVVERYRASLR
ncbi:CbiX/SirB N-terminal domain-containing protein [Microbacterium sp. NE2HP2]|uniref:sirohydrochlorin chelatase n=1 Tax=Microbacterium plantarum TaxID=1816425 RepID=UPI002365C768|nr:CbiX/SirB N-terminal domain-containing protein [Microbacterium plantarum]MDD7944165.1 CbiX/SirB N-terminal domain-containing protein [Microbacterium plantarum]